MKFASRPERQRVRFMLSFLAGMLAAVFAMAIGDVQRSEASTRYEDLSLFSSVVALVRRHYVEEIDEHRLLTGAIRGMLEELDPHSSFMEPSEFEEMQIDTKGEFHGLGIEITKAPNSFVEVVSPIEGTPADRAGIRARDQIVRICPTEIPDDWEEGEKCRPTKDMTLTEAVGLMRGKRGTEITVEIFREGFEEPQPFSVVRDVVQMPSVLGELLEPGYAYLRIRSFQERTARDLVEIIQALEDESPDGFSGLVLDLRNNPGGLLDQAVQVADVWLEDGLIVYTQGREEQERQDFAATPEHTQPKYPIVVIVNEGSASASEIVAGALQDQRRALVIGRGTFGKGSVQTVYPIDRYGLRLTTALYYTPGGRSIQEVGIRPDIEVEPPEPAKADARVPRHIRERDLQGHFTHEDADPDAMPQAEDPASEVESDDAADDREATPRPRSEDFFVARALEVLKSWTYFEKLQPGSREAAPSLQAKVRGQAPSSGDAVR